MKILVTVERVTDPDAKIEVRSDGSGVAVEGIDLKPNPFDEIAVEEALRLVKTHGGEVVVVSVGDPIPTKGSLNNNSTGPRAFRCLAALLDLPQATFGSKTDSL